MSESFYTHNAMQMMARQAAVRKVERACPVLVFRALQNLGGLVMSGVANTSAVEDLYLMVKAPEHGKTEAEDGATLPAPTASHTTRPVTFTTRYNS